VKPTQRPGRFGRSALARHTGTVVRRAFALRRAQPCLPAAAEDGVGGIAIDRRADRPTGPGDGQSAQQHQDAVKRWRRCPVWGSWTQRSRSLRIGPTSATFPSRNVSPPWVVLAGRRRERGVNYSHRSPKGKTVTCRRLLNQAANAAAKKKEASSRSCIAARPAPGHIKPLGPSPIDSVV